MVARGSAGDGESPSVTHLPFTLTFCDRDSGWKRPSLCPADVNSHMGVIWKQGNKLPLSSTGEGCARGRGGPTHRGFLSQTPKVKEGREEAYPESGLWCQAGYAREADPPLQALYPLHQPPPPPHSGFTSSLLPFTSWFFPFPQQESAR